MRGFAYLKYLQNISRRVSGGILSKNRGVDFLWGRKLSIKLPLARGESEFFLSANTMSELLFLLQV